MLVRLGELVILQTWLVAVVQHRKWTLISKSNLLSYLEFHGQSKINPEKVVFHTKKRIDENKTHDSYLGPMPPPSPGFQSNPKPPILNVKPTFPIHALPSYFITEDYLNNSPEAQLC